MWNTTVPGGVSLLLHRPVGLYGGVVRDLIRTRERKVDAVLWAASVKLFTLYAVAKAAVSDRLTRDERGEIGSWMILAAGLAVAAAAAVALLGPWFDEKANDITSN